MKRSLIVTVSAGALLAASGLAAAQTTDGEYRTDREGEVVTQSGRNDSRIDERAERGAERTGEAAEDAAEGTGDALGSANRSITRSVQQAFDGTSNFRSAEEIYGPDVWTAEQLTGLRVAGRNRNDIATVYDVIVDRNGKAQRVVLSDGGWLGLGQRFVAVPFESIRPVREDGAVDHVRIDETEEGLQNRREFTYGAGGQDGNQERMQAGWFSVEEMLGSEVQNPDNEQIATIDDVVFSRQGRAQAALLSVGGFLGMNERHVALDFNDLQVAEGEGGLVVQATRNQLENAPSVPLQARATENERRQREQRTDRDERMDRGQGNP